MIRINMDKAKEIKKDYLRQERASLFPKLDVEFMMALEAGDNEKVEEIKAKKQALRDVTVDPSIFNATDLDQLRNARPAIFDQV